MSRPDITKTEEQVFFPDDHNEYEDDVCPICGGEGFVFECVDGFCEDFEIGCDLCTRACDCTRAQAAGEDEK